MSDGPLTRARFTVPLDEARVAEEWRARGFSCQRFVDPPGREWRDFVHDCNELVTVIEGRLELTLRDECVLVEAGDEVLIPKGTVHSVRNLHSGATHWLFGYD